MVPTISQGPQSISDMQGTDARFSCFASGIPPPTILWTFTNNKNEATALSSTRSDQATGNATGELDLLDVTEENFGTYSCVAVNIILKSDKFYHTVSVICIHYPNCRVLYYTLNLLQLL